MSTLSTGGGKKSTPIPFRATPAAPCPVCGRGTKGCSATADGLHLCRGQPAGPGWAELVPADADGFAGYRRDRPLPDRRTGRRRAATPASPPPSPPAPATPPAAPARDWAGMAETYRRLTRPEDRDRLAAQLGLPAAVLDALGVGVSEWEAAVPVFSFPERDAGGAVVGITRRYATGAKEMMFGGRRGLSVPAGWRERAGAVYVPEGASDALALTAAGLAAVGRPSSAGGVEHLAGLLRDLPADRDVLILGENDRKADGRWPGRDGAELVARRLAAALNRPVAWVLPPEPAKDVRGWLTADALAELPWVERGRRLAAALGGGAVEPPGRPDPLAGDPAGDRRPLVYESVDTHAMADQTRQHLARVPGLYSRGGVLVQEVPEAPGRLRTVPADSVPELVSRNIRFARKVVQENGDVEERRVPPPPAACRSVHANPAAPIPEVDLVTHYPVVLADGRILSEPGYDAATRTIVAPPVPVAVAVPDRPTAADAKRVAELLLDVFREFPFPAGADGGRARSAVLALIITLITRPLVDGPTPFFLVQKNAPGSGGTLILKAVWRIVAGAALPTASYTHDEAESRKLLTSIVLDGRPATALDNIDGDFGTPSLCRFATADVWEDRVLGVNRLMKAPNRVVLFGSANNAVLLREMPRRTVTIDLHTDAENPERATKERPDLLGFIDARRGELLTAAFTILKAWLAAGRPVPADLPPFGSFEGWSRVVRAAVVFAGQPDPYTPTAARDDHRKRLLRAVAVGLGHLDGIECGLPAAEIVRRLNTSDYLPEQVREAADALAELTERVTAVSLGKILAANQNRNLGGVRIVEAAGRGRANMARWTVETIRKKPDRDDSPPVLSPASPAKEFMNEQLSAGDAGDKTGGRAVPAKKTATKSGASSGPPTDNGPGSPGASGWLYVSKRLDLMHLPPGGLDVILIGDMPHYRVTPAVLVWLEAAGDRFAATGPPPDQIEAFSRGMLAVTRFVAANYPPADIAAARAAGPRPLPTPDPVAGR